MEAVAKLRILTGALSDHLPGWLVLPGFRRRWSHDLRISDAKRVENQFATIQKQPLLDVYLDENLFLTKDVVLPRAAKANLDRVVDLNVRQSVPNDGRDLIWRSVMVSQSKSECVTRVFLLKRALLQQITDAAREIHVNIRTIRLADHASARPFLDRRPTTDRSTRIWGVATSLMATGLIAGLTVSELRQTHLLEQDLKTREDIGTELTAQALALRQNLDQESSVFAELARDVSLFENEYSRLPILLDLTEVFPDDTWVSEISITGSSMRMSGFTGQEMATLMDSIRAVDWVDTVKLGGPISFDSLSQSHRFDLVVSLAHVSVSKE